MGKKDKKNSISPMEELEKDDLGDIYLEGDFGDDEVRSSRSIHKFGATFSKTLNFSHYFFKFPLSIRREILFGRYNYLLEDRFGEETKYIDEKVLGVSFELLYFHKMALPLQLKYISNSFFGDSWKFSASLKF